MTDCVEADDGVLFCNKQRDGGKEAHLAEAHRQLVYWQRDFRELEAKFAALELLNAQLEAMHKRQVELRNRYAERAERVEAERDDWARRWGLVVSTLRKAEASKWQKEAETQQDIQFAQRQEADAQRERADKAELGANGAERTAEMLQDRVEELEARVKQLQTKLVRTKISLSAFQVEKAKHVTELMTAEAALAELEEAITLWHDHGSLHSEDCEGCRRAEFHRVTGTLPPKSDVPDDDDDDDDKRGEKRDDDVCGDCDCGDNCYGGEDAEKEETKPRIDIITDKKLLRQWNHDEPVLSISTNRHESLIPLSRVTGKRIEVVLRGIEADRENGRLTLDSAGELQNLSSHVCGEGDDGNPSCEHSQHETEEKVDALPERSVFSRIVNFLRAVAAQED